MSATFDFTTAPDRRGSDSSKWRKYQGQDILPLWIADMDFASPPCVAEALHARIDHGVFGYADTPPSLIEAVETALARDYRWAIKPEWLVFLPGLVPGLNLACRATGEPGSSVFTATPIYPPFLSAPEFSHRRLVTAPLALQNNHWQWDWPAVEAALTPDTRLFMLCNPHNPVGRAWRQDELARIGELALRHDLVICSDEIHCGLVLEPGVEHLPIAALDDALAKRTITLMAPSKTFNIAGLYCAFAIIPDAALRQRFCHEMRGILPPVSLPGMVAAEAAYRHGEPWRSALIDTLRHNRDLTLAAVGALPGLSAAPVEATHLAWIDCRATGIANPAAFFEQHGVGLNDGAAFGASGFVRLNFACPKNRLEEALARMAHALKSRPDAA